VRGALSFGDMGAVEATFVLAARLFERQVSPV
jgi:hypothetical protein